MPTGQRVILIDLEMQLIIYCVRSWRKPRHIPDAAWPSGSVLEKLQTARARWAVRNDVHTMCHADHRIRELLESGPKEIQDTRDALVASGFESALIARTIQIMLQSGSLVLDNSMRLALANGYTEVATADLVDAIQNLVWSDDPRSSR